jgi:hypothetical protein
MTTFLAFKMMMRKAKPGQHIRYHLGLLIDDRQKDVELDKIAKFVMVLYSLNTVRLYQKREGEECGYYVVPLKRLKVRQDQSGSYQEAERITNAES